MRYVSLVASISGYPRPAPQQQHWIKAPRVPFVLSRSLLEQTQLMSDGLVISANVVEGVGLAEVG